MPSKRPDALAAASGALSIAPGLTVCRLGFGAMRLTGPGVWGDPPDRAAAIKVLRTAVELGVEFIDTADSYGPFVAEEMIAEALYPYDGVTVATKGGLVRTGPGQWHPVGRPEYLRQCVEMSLRRLRTDTITLYQLHRIDPQVPLCDQIGVLEDMRQEGKIAHIGLSQVTVRDIAEARLLAPIVSVQNRYNLVNRDSEPVLDYCAREGLTFIPWAPMGSGELACSSGVLQALASQIGVTPAQLAIGWLLHRSPNILPIPGTASAEHLAQNMTAAALGLDERQFAAILEIDQVHATV
ncbi:MAG: aldo/keto reductase [Streptosporangiaceae bacterium]